jgi:hypothetical protein
VSLTIDPLISQKLQAFAVRRRKLIVRRGIYAAIATLVVAMMFVAFVDWMFILPDVVRWSLSGAAYLAIIFVEWRSCWRLLVHTPGPKPMARLFEHAEPKLREDLLSAVELGGSASDAVFDSEQFRALLQSDVAARVEKLDVEKLLPARLLRRYTLIAVGIGAACVIAFALTGLQFGTLMMRALLPMANFARVSKVKVKIVEPAPAEMRVPQGDTLPLLIELSGQLASKATMETFTPSGGREVVPMTPIGHGRFSATIQVGRENVFYRVRAGDAETQKYRLEAVPRPAVVDFQKAYTYPAYSRLPAKTVTEENGDLSALEGSQVTLRLRTNQKVRDAELRIEQGKKNAVVPLVADGDTLTATVPIDASGIYRVHLTGAESGFENKFSPEYELRAEPDLVPEVELESPKQDLILPSNEIVDVLGSASDDFALAKVSQLVKINDGPWKETTLGTEPGATMKIERRWDLFAQGVKPGDLVTTKLIAMDLKGNRAESRPLQVTITAAGFETKRLQALGGYRQLFEALKAEEAVATALVKQANEARQQYERLPDGDPQRQQIMAPVSANLEDLAQKNAGSITLLTAAMHDAIPGHQSGDLALLGRSIINAETDFTDDARRIVNVISTNTNLPGARELLGEMMNDIARADQVFRQVVESCRSLLTSEEIDVLNENLDVVAREQRRLLTLAHQSGDDREKWNPVANRLRVVASEMRGIEELSGAMIEHGNRGVPERMRNLQKLLNKRRTTLETALAGNGGVELLGPTMELTQAIDDNAHLALDMARDYRSQAVEALRTLTRTAEASYQGFEQLHQESERYFRNNRLPAEISANLIDSRWGAHLEALKSRGDIEEARPDADSYFVNDVRLTSRVLQALRSRAEGQKPEAWFKDLQAAERNFRVLEGAHLISEVVDGLTHLAASERWEIYNPKARTTNPHDWAWLAERLRLLPSEIGGALDFEERRKVGQDAQKILNDAQGQPFASALQQEMDMRFDLAREPVSTQESAQELADYVKQALDLLREPMEQARKNLTDQAPTLADAMKDLAKKTDELKDKTTNEAQQVHEQLPEESKAESQKVLAEQQRLNEQIEGLKDALRADANQQDILQKDGRERARDADDAMAMLKEPPERAKEDLDLAARSDKAAVQEQALNQAAEQQQKLSQALAQMADHYAAMAKGKPEETREAMRASEKQTGVKEQLDEDFAKAEQLAKLAQSSPEQMLAQLEKALPQNPQMQKELSAISQSALRSATGQLAQASTQESAVAQNVQKQLSADQAQAAAAQANNATPPAQTLPPPPTQSSLPNSAANNPPSEAAQAVPQSTQPIPPASSPLTQAAQQQTPIADAAGQAADDISRAGRHETRLDNKVAGEQLQQLGKQVEAAARHQVPEAQQALQQAQQAMQAKPAVDAANSGLRKSLDQLAAISDPAQAQGTSSPSPATESAPAAPSGQTASASFGQSSTPAAPGASSPPAAQTQPPTAAAPEDAQAAMAHSPRTANVGEIPMEGLEVAGIPEGKASPQEQVWMARTLDALDAAMHAQAGNAEQQGKEGSAPGQNAQQSQNTSQASQTSAAQSASNKPVPQSNSLAQAKSAMNAAAQAAAAAARSARQEAGSPDQQGQPQPGSLQAESKNGMQAAGANGPHGALGEAKMSGSDWGKLPKQMAEQLTQGEREGIAGEYRNQVETYYRAIAEKSKKP